MQKELSARLPEKHGLLGVRGDTLSIQRVDWLWEPYIPRGMITAVFGDPAAGKSYMMAGVTTCLTSGCPWPLSQERRPPENVIMLNSEDAVQETQLPRLKFLGADMTRVFLTRKGFTINRQTLPELREFVHCTNASMLSIDPIQSWMGTGYDMNKATDVRSWTDILGELAEETGIAVVLIGHKRKSKKSDGDDNPLYQGLGSIDFVGKARSVLHVCTDDSGLKYMEHVKPSVGAPGTPIEFKIEPCEWGDSPFSWVGAYQGASYARAKGLSPAFEAACEWLKLQIKDGARPAEEIKLAASALDPPIGMSTLHRARAMVAESIRRGNDWYWELKSGATGVAIE